MTVYADILIILNTVIDYFILLTAEKIAAVENKLSRRIFAAFLGGMLSLYIFAPDYGLAVNFAVWLLSGAIIVLTAYSGKITKKYFSLFVGYVFTNAVYGGIVIAFWTFLKPKGMIVYNGIVYYQLSPIVLLTVTVLCYASIALAGRYFKTKVPLAQKCIVKIFDNGSMLELVAIIDTGHSLCEPFSEKSVIVADANVIENAFKSADKNKYRIIPYKDISGRGVLNAFIAQKAEILVEEKVHTVLNPVVACAKTGMLTDDFTALISPQIFEQETECAKL